MKQVCGKQRFHFLLGVEKLSILQPKKEAEVGEL